MVALEPDEAAVFVYSGATAPPRRFSEPDTAAVLIGDLQEQYGCVILSETFKTPLSPILRRAGRGGHVRLFRSYGATETLLGTRHGGGIDRRPSRTIWLRDFIGDFQDAVISNLAASRTRWPCSSIPALRRHRDASRNQTRQSRRTRRPSSSIPVLRRHRDASQNQTRRRH
ncbi:hypothetical protein U1Q18_023807 [Sarracenia purpurea var. burkii]